MINDLITFKLLIIAVKVLFLCLIYHLSSFLSFKTHPTLSSTNWWDFSPWDFTFIICPHSDCSHNLQLIEHLPSLLSNFLGYNLRSSTHHLLVSVTAFKNWNLFPLYICQFPSLFIFKTCLKIHPLHFHLPFFSSLDETKCLSLVVRR